MILWFLFPSINSESIFAFVNIFLKFFKYLESILDEQTKRSHVDSLQNYSCSTFRMSANSNIKLSYRDKLRRNHLHSSHFCETRLNLNFQFYFSLSLTNNFFLARMNYHIHVLKKRKSRSQQAVFVRYLHSNRVRSNNFVVVNQSFSDFCFSIHLKWRNS